MRSAGLGNAVWGAIAATVAALGLSYFVTAGLMPTAQPAAGGAPVPRGTAPGLVLTHAPELRARPALFRTAPAIAQPAPAAAMAPAPADDPAATPAAAAEPSTSAAAAPAQSTPAAAPAEKPTPKPQTKPTLSAQPTKPSNPDFDEAAPGGFDSSG